MKKFVSVVLAVVMILTVVPINTKVAYAAATSGYCGAEGQEKSVMWEYKDGVLTISGQGAMVEYAEFSPDNYPWNMYYKKTSKIVIGEGVTSIARYAFYNFEATEIELPANSLKKVGESAFQFCNKINMSQFILPESIKSLGYDAFQIRGIQYLYIPGSIKDIINSMFCGDGGVAVFGEGCKIIGNYTLDGDYRKIILPSTIEEIGSELIFRPPATREYLEKIDSSAKHLLGLINDILDMSRIESGRLVIKSEEFAFSKLMEQVNTIISGQCREKGLTYDCRINGEIDDYYIGDDMKLRQVLINILGNAVKFTQKGGKIDFIVTKTAGYDGKSTLRFEMKDTGVGMSKDYLPKIFETFSQEDSTAANKYGSSGLGMAITKNIVEMMNGKIEVESEKGKGTTFTVTVTLLDSDREDSGEEDDMKIVPGEMSVLVVDDDKIAGEHAKLVLEKVGISAEVAFSGGEAVEMVKLHHARREPYNLIIVDWQMPEMDGVETTRQIRSVVGNESAIIILTAYHWDDILEEATEAGVDSFIAKPLFSGNLLDEFKKALKKKRMSSAGKKKKADLTGRRILLAEDVEINAEIMVEILKMNNMETEHAGNGKIAVAMFSDHPEGYYDAILMDMRMPEMDGLEATKAIRAMDREDAKNIPIIALTANAFDEDVQRSLQAGLNAHLSKPVDPDILYETLGNMIV